MKLTPDQIRALVVQVEGCINDDGTALLVLANGEAETVAHALRFLATMLELTRL